MSTEPIKLDYEGLRWDGTVESAEAICEAILWAHPRYYIERWYDADGGPRQRPRRLTIGQGYSSDAPSFRLKAGDMLACSREAGTGWLVPERVVEATTDRPENGEGAL